MADTDHRFVVECPECELGEATDDMDEALDFSTMHKEHTGHNPEWVEADFETEFDVDLTRRWWVKCDHCPDSWTFDSKDEAMDFYLDHAEYTDHSAREPVETAAENSDIDDVRSFVRRFSDHGDLDHGVPLPLLFATLGDLGVDQTEISRQVEKLRQRGEVYEPKAGYLRAT